MTQDSRPGTKRVRPAPEDQEEPDEGGDAPGEPGPNVEDRRHLATDRSREAGRPGDSAAEHDQDPVENDRPADLTEDLAGDQPDVMNRRPVLGLRERVDHVVAEEPPGDEHEQPDENERPADVEKRLAPLTAREIDGERRREGTRARAARRSATLTARTPCCAYESWSELMIVIDPGVGWKLIEGCLRHAELEPELGQQLADVERHARRCLCRSRTRSCSRAR